MNVFDRLVTHFGNSTKLANAVGVSAMAVSKWKTGKIPVERVKQLVELTGGKVSAADMRPDIFA